MDPAERLDHPVAVGKSIWQFPPPPPDDVGDRAFAGADLVPATILEAYRNGLFPMPIDYYDAPGEVAWWTPNPRGILIPDDLRVSRSLRRSMRRFDVTTNRDFPGVIDGCRHADRDGAWISREMRDAYVQLHELGWAHSVEVWNETGDLVGGLYGVGLHGLFAGESMFSRATDASKVALVHLVELVEPIDDFLIDVQWQTPHLATLGISQIQRSGYHRLLRQALRLPQHLTFERFQHDT